MYKYILMITCCIALTTGCKKDSEDPAPATTTTDPVDNTQITAVPSSFTQKVLMEIFTGAGQPQCTDGFVKESDIANSYPSLAIPVRIHYSDAMEISYYTTVESTFNNSIPPTFPSAMINRTPSLGMVILNRTQWMSNFNTVKAKTATCGLAVKSNVTGTTATIEVHAGFKQTLSGNYNVTVMLVEDNVEGNGNQFDQRNSYNTTSGHPYYGSGDPILNFNHSHTLRKVLSADIGDAISAASITAGAEVVKSYNVNIAAYKQNDLYVVAFINKTGSSSTTHEVMNVQRVKLGSTQNWD